MKFSTLLSAVVAITCGMSAWAQDIELPAPDKTGGKPLMQTLAARKSSRTFMDKELSLQTLSSLLWAADGINRADGRKTAPTGMNVQDTDVYAMLKAGIYKYDAKANKLILVVSGDHRELAGRQPYPRTAPLNLFFIHDKARAMKGTGPTMDVAAGIHVGAIMQNVYLFCASEGLGCVARMSIDTAELGKLMKLPEGQSILLGETIGYETK
jgi:nitroreductase